MRSDFAAVFFALSALVAADAAPLIASQAAPAIELRAGVLPPDLRLDGVLNDRAWASAPAIDQLTMSEPLAGGPSSSRTRVQVLANAGALVIGITCDDPDPTGIVSFTKQRDGALSSEDHVTIV